MKKTLFIGSTVLDMVVNLDHLPAYTEDINTESIQMSLGGCAYNASNILHHLEMPYVLCSALGDGFFSNCVERLLSEVDRTPFIRLKGQDNGVCICLVDKDGERSFLSQHGVEYHFHKEWLNDLDLDEYDSIYVCGLEIEDVNGEEIIEFLEEHKEKTIYFAPASRILKIQPERMKKMMNLKPILHMNHSEALNYTNTDTLEEAIHVLYQQNHNKIIITSGSEGAYAYENETITHIPSIPCQVTDTIGAGDSHIGSIIAFENMGYSLLEALNMANHVSAKVVSIKGAALTKEQLKEALQCFHL